MGWESRNGTLYYYQKERSGGRVRSIYVGRSEIAGVIDTLDGLQRHERNVAGIKEKREREALESLDASIDSLARLSSTLTQAFLIAGGFHRHKRQWRKRRA